MHQLARYRDNTLARQPSNRVIAAKLRRSPTQIQKWLYSRVQPQQESDVLQLVAMVRAEAKRCGDLNSSDAELLAEQEWREAYRTEAHRRAHMLSGSMRSGQARRILEGFNIDAKDPDAEGIEAKSSSSLSV